MSNNDTDSDIIAQTESFLIWSSNEAEEGDTLFHIELGGITLHMTSEEWDEFVVLMKSVS